METSTTAVAASQRRQPDFFKFWAAQSVSIAGSRITEVALPLTAVTLLHTDAAEMGVLNAARWLPFVVFALIAGAWADRMRRRPTLIGADLFRAVALAAIIWLAVAGALSLPLLVLLVFALGSGTVLFDVCYHSYLPSLVAREQLVTANARLQASASVFRVGGPGLGGLLVQALSAPFALAADAVSFIVSAVFLTSIRHRESKPEHNPAKTPLSDIWEGLVITFRNTYLRAFAGTSALYNLFDQWITTLFILYAVNTLGFNAGEIGVVLATGALGAVLGSVVAGRVTQWLGAGRALLWSVVVECGVFFVFALTLTDDAWAMSLLLVAFFLNGAGTALSSVVAISVRQAVTPDRLLGRISASYRFLSSGVIPVGALLGGLAGQALGLRFGLVLGAIGSLSAVAWVLASPLPRLRRIEDAPSVDAPDAAT